MHVCASYVCLVPALEEARSGTVVTGGCESPSGCLEWKGDPLQEQVLLTINPSLQPRILFKR